MSSAFEAPCRLKVEVRGQTGRGVTIKALDHVIHLDDRAASRSARRGRGHSASSLTDTY